MVKRFPKFFFFLFFLFLAAGPFGFVASMKAQSVPVHIDHTGIYTFIDELANMGVIEVNSLVKPYSRKDIADWLILASKAEGLSRRQEKEIEFYLRDFGKELSHKRPENKRLDLFYYSDSIFRLTVNPILGLEVFSSGGEMAYHRYNGGEMHGTIGDHFGFYGSLRDNHESKILAGPAYLTDRRGAVYKGDEVAQDYSEARGGISWTWDWGEIGLHKDHYTWGHGYNGANILSGNTPSHAFLSLNIKPVPWFELNYMHGWLVSEVVDSLRSFGYYDGTREVFADKYLAANFMTVRPLKGLNVSVGNSIIYADTRINPAFLVPFLFYKSVDHTYNGASNEVGQNAQMFFDISSRQIKHLHLYSTVFVDEISFNRMFDSEQNSNYVSAKLGARLSELPAGFTFTMEYTRTNPMVYQHKIPTTTWTSNQYNMGHYLKDNSDEVYLEVQYKPVRGLNLQLSYTKARKGKDYQAILIEGNEALYPEINMDEPRWGLPFMDEVRFEMQKIEFKGSWQVINDGYVFLSLANKDISGPDVEKYYPPFFLEGNFTGSFGVNFGF
jgi:hypothetical protein